MERLVKGDQVVVTVGKDRGKQGEILRRVEGGKFVVQGINLVKKHTKPNPALGRTGGIVEKEMPIHISNVVALNNGIAGNNSLSVFSNCSVPVPRKDNCSFPQLGQRSGTPNADSHR